MVSTSPLLPASWRVLVEYAADASPHEQDAIDRCIDHLAELSGVVVDSGSGTGFGRREVDVTYETEVEAAELVRRVEAAFSDRPRLGLLVRTVPIEA